MAAKNSVTIIIFDVGRNAVECRYKNGQTFFDRAKECVARIIQQKIFARPRDEIGLLLIGTDGTENSLNSEIGGFEHISIGFPVTPVDWNMLKYVESSIDPQQNDITADWVSAVVVAMDELERMSLEKSKSNIILLTTFTTSVDDSNLATVENGLRGKDIELTVISHCIEYGDGESAAFSQNVNRDGMRLKSEKVAKQLIDQTEGVLCSFDEALPQLICVELKQRVRRPWNCDLQIGDRLAIKIAAYIYVERKNEMGPWKPVQSRASAAAAAGTAHGGAGHSTGGSVVRKTDYILDDEILTAEKALDELVKGYMYGMTPVAFDLASKFQSGGKQLRFIGFTKQARLSDYHLQGDKTYVVVAQNGYPVAMKTFAALTNAMRKRGWAMVARYVYNASTNPKLMVLFPNDKIKNCPQHNSLLMCELFFAQNMRQEVLPSWRRLNTEPSVEQYEAIDRLMDAFDLMNAVDGDANVDANDVDDDGQSGEAFRKLLNPMLQHRYRAIAHRALHPDEPVLGIDEDLKKMLFVPTKLQPKIDDESKGLKELFELKKIKPKANRKFSEKFTLNDDENRDSGLADVTASSNQTIGSSHIEVRTIATAEDFTKHLELGEKFSVLAEQMMNLLEELIFKTIDLQCETISNAIFEFRKAAKDRAPYLYNGWISELKSRLFTRRRNEVWQKLIVVEKYGPITERESSASTVTEEEANSFYTIVPKVAVDVDEGVGKEAGSTGVEEEEFVQEIFGQR